MPRCAWCRSTDVHAGADQWLCHACGKLTDMLTGRPVIVQSFNSDDLSAACVDYVKTHLPDVYLELSKPLDGIVNTPHHPNAPEAAVTDEITSSEPTLSAPEAAEPVAEPVPSEEPTSTGGPDVASPPSEAPPATDTPEPDPAATEPAPEAPPA